MVKVGGKGDGEDDEAAVSFVVYVFSSNNDDTAEKIMDCELD